jgi:hypothetical protein
MTILKFVSTCLIEYRNCRVRKEDDQVFLEVLIVFRNLTLSYYCHGNIEIRYETIICDFRIETLCNELLVVYLMVLFHQLWIEPQDFYEVSRPDSVNSSVFWDITPCSPLKVNVRFGGTCRLLLHGGRIIQARKPA